MEWISKKTLPSNISTDTWIADADLIDSHRDGGIAQWLERLAQDRKLLSSES